MIENNNPTNHNGLKPNLEFKKPNLDAYPVHEDIADIIIKCHETQEAKKPEITGEQLLLTDVTQIPFLVEPFLQQTGLACLAGSSDTGKSSLLRQLAIAVATGEPEFLGFKINARHRSAIYVSTEDLERETAYLLYRQVGLYTPDELARLRFVFDTANLLDELNGRLTRQPADLVIIDCFSDAFGGDLKDTQKIRAYLQPYQDLAKKHDCLILFLHHTGKRTENIEPSKNNLLSGQGFEAKMRLVIELRVDLMNPNYRHMCIVKGNYLPASYKRESYVLQFNTGSFTFSNTGERVPFDLLTRQPETDNSKEKYEYANQLKQQGQSYSQIAEKMGYSSKSTVAGLFEKAKKNGWDKMPPEDTSVQVEGVPF